ncbi:hypothetical protein RB213_013471, partial [Colletotrichum asianum]
PASRHQTLPNCISSSSQKRPAASSCSDLILRGPEEKRPARVSVMIWTGPNLVLGTWALASGLSSSPTLSNLGQRLSFAPATTTARAVAGASLPPAGRKPFVEPT